MPKRERRNGEALGISLEMPAIVARQKKCRVRGGGDNVFKIDNVQAVIARIAATLWDEPDFATATATAQARARHGHAACPSTA